MARPIRETPILTGDDAIRFVDEMEKVDNLSSAERVSNHLKFQNDVKSALATITVCF